MRSMRVGQLIALGDDAVRRRMSQLQDGNAHRFASRHRLASGEIRDVEVFSGMARYEGDELVHSLVIDVTAGAEASRELDRARDFFEQKFMQAGVSTQILDQDGWCERVNPKFCELFRVRREDMEGRRYNIFQDQAVRTTAVLGFLERVFRGHEVVEGEVHFDLDLASSSTGVPVSSGGKTWFWVRAYPIVTPDGQLVHVVLQHQDISARKAREAALEHARAVLERVQRLAGIGSWELDLRSSTMTSSPEAHRIFGIPEGPHPLETVLSAVLEEDRPAVAAALAACVEGAPHNEVRFRIHRIGDGATRELFVMAELETEHARVTGFVEDETDKRAAAVAHARLEVQFAHAQRIASIGRLAGGVAHDFNNMLGVILAASDLASSALPPEHAARREIDAIRTAAQRSADLTRQLLAFARKQPIAPRAVALDQAVSGMLQMLGRLVGEQVTIEWAAQPGLWSVQLAPSQLDQVLANLCVNARDAIEGCGTIRIEAANVRVEEGRDPPAPELAPGEYVRLSVADDGRGMDARTVASIFEPFFTTKEVGQGTGLGLATVYGIVHQNRGGIAVQSEPGVGTRFDLYWPRFVVAPEPTRAPSGRPGASARGVTVLLVEDEAMLLRLSRRLLEGLGYTVLAAAGPVEALELEVRHTGTIELLLSDVVMPVMNGRALAERILARRPDVRCLFMSGYVADVVTDRGALPKGMHFLEKPFTPAVLAAKVREVLEAEA
jgi:PAS domain S-box-containing protein